MQVLLHWVSFGDCFVYTRPHIHKPQCVVQQIQGFSWVCIGRSILVFFMNQEQFSVALLNFALVLMFKPSLMCFF